MGYYQWCKNTKSLDSDCMTKIKHSPFLAVFSRYGKLLVSPDPTLKKGTFSSCRNSTAIYKNQRRGSQSPRFKITILKTGEEPPTNRNTPSLAQQLESKHRFIISHFIQIQTFFHSHPPIHLSNTAYWRTLSMRIWKRIRSLARPSFPGGLGPSEQTRKVMT